MTTLAFPCGFSHSEVVTTLMYITCMYGVYIACMYGVFLQGQSLKVSTDLEGTSGLEYRGLVTNANGAGLS